jgi:hypothetical protein|tara:strand:+ start:913 stop:1353 length:441 start_codon:yes stop_codon:yes gene_type:complete
MKKEKKKPYVIYMAEVIYNKIIEIKKNNPDISNIDAVERFIGTKVYEDISSGSFHDNWFETLKKNKFIDKDTGEKIPNETIKILEIQKEITMKQFMKYPNLYYTKSSFPLEISQRSFDHLWRICESYELWCKEAGKFEEIVLKIVD